MFGNKEKPLPTSAHTERINEKHLKTTHTHTKPPKLRCRIRCMASNTLLLKTNIYYLKLEIYVFREMLYSIHFTDQYDESDFKVGNYVSMHVYNEMKQVYETALMEAMAT